MALIPSKNRKIEYTNGEIQLLKETIQKKNLTDLKKMLMESESIMPLYKKNRKKYLRILKQNKEEPLLPKNIITKIKKMVLCLNNIINLNILFAEALENHKRELITSDHSSSKLLTPQMCNIMHVSFDAETITKKSSIAFLNNKNHVS